jgi:hypothetical protein
MKYIYIIATLLFLASCAKEVGKNPDLQPKIASSDSTLCDSVKYSTTILPIINAECIGCHSPGSANGDLSTYAALKLKADGGRITARVLNGNPSFMPQAGAMSQDKRDKIKCWLDAGAPNN